MEQKVKIFCKNTGTTVMVPLGATLEDVYAGSGLQMEHGPICAHVNNKVTGMHYRLYNRKTVEFLDMTTPSGSRTYTRSLFFVLCKAVQDLYPGSQVIIDIPVSNGYHCELQIGHDVTADDIDAIRRRMDALIAAALPICRHECSTEEELFDLIRRCRENPEAMRPRPDQIRKYHKYRDGLSCQRKGMTR